MLWVGKSLPHKDTDPLASELHRATRGLIVSLSEHELRKLVDTS
jgi:hypothetical protein